MIKLAANGIPALYELLYCEDLPLEYIKCPLSPGSRAEVGKARRYLPVLLHGWGPPGYSVTMREIPQPELLVELARRSGTPFLSAHLEYDPERDGVLRHRELLERIRQSVEHLEALTGLEVLLENVPWYPWKSRPPFSTNPEFFTEALAQSGARLLLDLAHARVAAWHRQEPEWAYLRRFPLEQVVEIHVSGPRMGQKGLQDWHMPLGEEDYALLRGLLAYTPNLKVLTLEYMIHPERTQLFGEPQGPQVLLTQLERLDTLRQQPHLPTTPELFPSPLRLSLRRP